MIVAIGWVVFKMNLKYGADGWSQWFTLTLDGSELKYVGMVVQIQFSGKVVWVSTGKLVAHDVWEVLLHADADFISEYDPDRMRVKKPKGLVMLEESMYKLNITGNTEQKLLENT